MSELNDVLTRLSRLERENRRLKRAGSLFALTLVGALAVGFAAPRDGVLRGEALELTRAGEKEPYAVIEIDDKGFPLLALRKDASHALMTLNRPAVHVRDVDGRRGAFLGFDTRGLGKVALSGEQLGDAVHLTMDKDGRSGVAVLDPEGFTRGALEYLGEDGVGMRLFGERGAIRSSVAVDRGDNASALLLDSSARKRVGMMVEANGTPTISLTDERTVSRINLSMDFDGAPRVEFLRADGRVGTKLP